MIKVTTHLIINACSWEKRWLKYKPRKVHPYEQVWHIAMLTERKNVERQKGERPKAN